MREIKMTASKRSRVEKMLLKGSSVREISKATGMTVPTIYRYFPGGTRAWKKNSR